MLALSLAYVLAFSLDLADQLSALFAQPQTWAVVLSLLTPAAIAVIKQPAIPDRFDRPIAWAFALTVGFLTVYTAGQFNPADLLTSLVLVVAATEASYKVIWKGTYPLTFLQALTDVLKPKVPSTGPAERRPKDAAYRRRN